MIGWGIALTLLLALGFLRFGVGLSWHGRLRVWAFVGPLRLTLLPAKPKKPRKPKPEKKLAKDEPPAEETPKPPRPPFLRRGDIGDLLRLLRRLMKLMLGRTLRVDKLWLAVTVGDDEADRAAIRYGQVNALIGIVYPFLDEHMRLRRQRYEVRLDFGREDTVAELDLQLSVSLGRVLQLGLTATGLALGFWQRHNKRPARAATTAGNSGSDDNKPRGTATTDADNAA